MKSCSSILMWFTVSFCFNSNNESKPLLIKFMQQKNSTLDSLQGKWISEEDSLLRWQINGRTLNESYNDEDSIKNRHSYHLFFSDTLVNKYLQYSLGELKFDTTITSGKFIVAVSDEDSTVWCYQIENISLNNGTSIDELSVSDTWAKFSTVTFRKQ